jgi:hypothetical protein
MNQRKLKLLENSASARNAVGLMSPLSLPYLRARGSTNTRTYTARGWWEERGFRLNSGRTGPDSSEIFGRFILFFEQRKRIDIPCDSIRFDSSVARGR